MCSPSVNAESLEKVGEAVLSACKSYVGNVDYFSLHTEQIKSKVPIFEKFLKLFSD